MTTAERKQSTGNALRDYFDNQERERLGLRKKTQYAGSEKSEQAKLAAWLDQHNILWLHPANERKATARQHALLAGQGVKSGAPDVLIFSHPSLYPTGERFRGVAIELKRVSSKATVSVNQLTWLDNLRNEGWLARVCQGAGEAIRWLESLGFGL